MLLFFLLHSSIVSISLVVSQGTEWSGQFLTLNECGSFDEYQKFSYGSDKTIKLNSMSNTCLQCSGVGYCTDGFFPVMLSPGCSGSNYMTAWNTKTISNSAAVNLEINNLCLQSMGSDEYAMIQMIPCNSGYGNDIYSEWLINPNNNNYIVSNSNNSLCLTAGYYPPINCTQSPFNKYDYCNQQLPTDNRVNDLISRMTLWEKVSNLAYANIGIPRLGIPPNKQLECLHGIRTIRCGKTYNGNTGCPSSFPHALLLGATFNRSLWLNIASAISDEGRALNNQGIGGLYCYSPDINLFRDPRWGRGQEVPGEDPFLTGQYAQQYINGIQYGEDHKYLKMSNTVKHYADYDLEGGRYGIPARTSFNAVVNEQDQVEYYWPAWRTAITTANAQSMMCSYPSINSIPACGNDYFMNQIARDEWGFDGFIISDQGAIADDAFTQYVKANNNGNDDPLLRCKIAIEGGCDANIGGVYLTYLFQTVNQSYLTENAIDNAVKRFLVRTIDLGLIDYPGPYYNTYDESYVDSPSNRKLSYDAAVQGIVLLKNYNNTLPLKRDNSIKYGFIGPHFTSTQYLLSSYVGTNTLVNSHSPYQIGIKQGVNIQYAKGCDLGCTDTSGFSAAINVAKNVDFPIVFLGLEPLNFAQSGDNYNEAVESENFDRENITFPGEQLSLLQQVFDVNPNTILVLINGSPIDLTWPKQHLKSIIESFYPGEMGGDAILSILFGDISPSGKLPYTIYDVSLTNNRSITDMGLRSNIGITYRYYNGQPVYKFGEGLSYTTFEYKYFNISVNNNNNINTATLANWYRNRKYLHYDDSTSFIVQVTNTGNMDSDCVVLGFVSSDHDDSPNIKLFDFQRTFIKIGDSVNVTLSITPETISLTNKKGIERIVPGKYTIYLGDYQTNNRKSIKTYFNLIGNEEIIFNLQDLKQKHL